MIILLNIVHNRNYLNSIKKKEIKKSIKIQFKKNKLF